MNSIFQASEGPTQGPKPKAPKPQGHKGPRPQDSNPFMKGWGWGGVGGGGGGWGCGVGGCGGGEMFEKAPKTPQGVKKAPTQKEGPKAPTPPKRSQTTRKAPQHNKKAPTTPQKRLQGSKKGTKALRHQKKPWAPTEPKGTKKASKRKIQKETLVLRSYASFVQRLQVVEPREYSIYGLRLGCLPATVVRILHIEAPTALLFSTLKIFAKGWLKLLLGAPMLIRQVSVLWAGVWL